MRVYYGMRAPTHTSCATQHLAILFVLQATGCEAQFTFDDKMYYPMQHCEALGSRYKQHAGDMGLVIDEGAEGYQLHAGESGYQLHAGEWGYQLHAGESGYQLHAGESGYQLHAGESGYQLHAGE